MTQKIESIQDEIRKRLGRIHRIPKENGYPDMQTFKRAYEKATALVEQYQRELAEWEWQTGENRSPMTRPPEKESLRKRLREMQEEAKPLNKKPHTERKPHEAQKER